MDSNNYVARLGSGYTVVVNGGTIGNYPDQASAQQAFNNNVINAGGSTSAVSGPSSSANPLAALGLNSDGTSAVTGSSITQTSINAAKQAADAAFQLVEGNAHMLTAGANVQDAATRAAAAAATAALGATDTLLKTGGPRNAFIQQAVIHGLNSVGLSKAVDYVNGLMGVPATQAPQANPQPLTLTSLSQDLQGGSPTGVTGPAIAGAQTGGATGTPSTSGAVASLLANGSGGMAAAGGSPAVPAAYTGTGFDQGAPAQPVGNGPGYGQQQVAPQYTAQATQLDAQYGVPSGTNLKYFETNGVFPSSTQAAQSYAAAGNQGYMTPAGQPLGPGDSRVLSWATAHPQYTLLQVQQQVATNGYVFGGNPGDPLATGSQQRSVVGNANLTQVMNNLGLDANGQPLTGAQLQAYKDNVAPGTDLQGHYGLPAGTPVIYDPVGGGTTATSATSTTNTPPTPTWIGAPGADTSTPAAVSNITGTPQLTADGSGGTTSSLNPADGGTTVIGGVHYHMGGTGGGMATNSVGAPATITQGPVDPTTAAYTNALPAPNKINGPAFQQLGPDTQAFLESAYNQAGYSTNDITNAVAQGLPQFKAPATGGVSPSGLVTG